MADRSAAVFGKLAALQKSTEVCIGHGGGEVAFKDTLTNVCISSP